MKIEWRFNGDATVVLTPENEVEKMMITAFRQSGTAISLGGSDGLTIVNKKYPEPEAPYSKILK